MSGTALADADYAGDLRDDVVQALEVLHVDRRVDVDPGLEQLADVLPALQVTRARGVGVGQLVDEDELRLAREGGVEVELLEGDGRDASELSPAGKSFEPDEERAGVVATVGLGNVATTMSRFWSSTSPRAASSIV